MHARVRWNKACCAAALLAALAIARAQTPAQTVWIPMQETGVLGQRTIQLEATLYKPDGAGPFPVLVFNHGSSGGPIPADYTENPRGLASYLNARGISLLVPMRRGRGKSEGSNAEEPSPCTVEGARAGIDYASAALDASFAYLRQQSWAAMDKVLLAGHSRGGILSVVYAAEHPGVAVGVVNFSGGWKSDNCGPADVNLALFEAAAIRTKVPHLFLYAQGDGFYADASMQKYADTFRAAGGQVEFRLFKLENMNGHQLFHRARRVWEKDLDAFIEHTGLPPPPQH
ncbi:MAG: dienelactone hydrolase family protein [Rhodoferax sp.]